MRVEFVKSLKVGGRTYPKGQQEVSDNLAYNIDFKKLVVAGAVRVMRRNEHELKIQSHRDMKALQAAKNARKASLAKKALQSASKPAQAILKPVAPATPALAPKSVAGAAAKVAETAAPATAPTNAATQKG